MKEYSYVLAKLYPKDKNLKSRWFVGYSIWDVQQKKLVQQQIRLPKKLITKKEREDWAKIKIKEINQGLVNNYVIDQPESKTNDIKEIVSVEIGLTKMLDLKKLEIRKKTLSTYQSIINKFLDFLHKNLLFNTDIRLFNVELSYKYRDWLQVNKANDSTTINNNVGVISSLFEMAAKRAFIIENPFKSIKSLPQIQSIKNVAFTKEHQTILELWLIENNPDLYLFTRFLYYAFIRPKELRQLQYADIDLVKSKILVKAIVSKNKKTQIVPIHSTLRDLILKHEVPSTNKNIFGNLLVVFGYGVCSENYAYNLHCEALKACKLDVYGYTLYSWKHTGACGAINAGMNPRKLQGLLRHSSLEETDTYLRGLGVSLGNEPILENW